MEHWTKRLPEAGTDFYAFEAADIDRRISTLEAQLVSLRKVQRELEEEAMRWAKRHWTAEEIAEAKKA